MSVCAEHMLALMRRQIFTNGNGSWFMKSTAIAQVKEILHEIVDGCISIEGGIDEDALKGAEEAVMVRTMVVIHGNQAGGKLKTKPGQDTYGKHVVAKGPSSAQSVYDLPGAWNMYDVTKGIIDNTMKETKKYFDDMIKDIATVIPDIIIGHITGG